MRRVLISLKLNNMWHAFVWLIAIGHTTPYGTIRFIMPLQVSEQDCRFFVRDFVKAESHAQPPHAAKYNCFKVTK